LNIRNSLIPPKDPSIVFLAKRSIVDRVWERLDKVVATTDWFSLFPDTRVYHLDVTTSDHKTLWIVPDGMDYRQ